MVNLLTSKVLPDDPRKAQLVLRLARKGYSVVGEIFSYEGLNVPD